MKRRFLSAIVAVILTLGSSVMLFAYNNDSQPEGYYMFNQFFVDHFAGCANGSIGYLSDYPIAKEKFPAGDGTAIDITEDTPEARMRYIAENTWIPIAGYSPTENVMYFEFVGEQVLDYTSQNIQIPDEAATANLADAVAGLSKSDIAAIRDMLDASDGFEFYLDYDADAIKAKPVAPCPTCNGVAPTVVGEPSGTYTNFGNYLQLLRSDKVNVTVGAGAVLPLIKPVHIGAIYLESGATLDLSGIAPNALPTFNNVSIYKAEGATILLPGDAKAQHIKQFNKKVNAWTPDPVE